jgi:hypothetical protein
VSALAASRVHKPSAPMRRLAPLPLLAALLLTLPILGCAGGRDAHDVAADLEGTVSPQSAERLLRDVDLARAPVEISAGDDFDQTFAQGDQGALEQFLRDAAGDLAGDSVRVTQQTVEETGANAQRLAATLEVQHQGHAVYVPVELDLVRDGRRVFVTHVRVMIAGSVLRATNPAAGQGEPGAPQ